MVEGYGFSLFVLAPVVAIGCQSQNELIVGNIACRPVGGTFYKLLRAYIARLACRVVLVVRHQEEIVVVLGELLQVVVFIEWSHILGNIESFLMEDCRQFAHKGGEQGVVVQLQVFQVDVDSAEIVLTAGSENFFRKQFSLACILHDSADGFASEVFAIVVGKHRHYGHACLLRQAKGFLIYLSIEHSGFRIDEQPFAHEQVDVTDVALQ